MPNVLTWQINELMNTFVTEQQFFELVPESIRRGCRDATQKGFDTYAEKYSNVADAHQPRSVASVIHDHICEIVKRDVCDESFVFRFIKQRNMFIYRDSVIITFKKFDEELKSQNYPTATAEKFAAQEEVEGIPANLPRVEIGYVSDPAGTTVNGIFAVYRVSRNKKIDWNINLNESDDFRQRDINIA